MSQEEFPVPVSGDASAFSTIEDMDIGDLMLGSEPASPGGHLQNNQDSCHPMEDNDDGLQPLGGANRGQCQEVTVAAQVRFIVRGQN